MLSSNSTYTYRVGIRSGVDGFIFEDARNNQPSPVVGSRIFKMAVDRDLARIEGRHWMHNFILMEVGYELKAQNGSTIRLLDIGRTDLEEMFRKSGG